MQSLKVESGMLSLFGGVFYPKGYTMVMYPTEALASEVAHRLLRAGFHGDQIYAVSAATVLNEITPTVAGADDPLPSVGSEAANVREFTQLAREGHFGLLIHSGDDAARERMREIISDTPYAVAKFYRTLVIEDL